MVASLLFRRLMPEHHYIPLMTVMSLPHILWLRRVDSEAQRRLRHTRPHAGEQAAYEESEFTGGFDQAPSEELARRVESANCGARRTFSKMTSSPRKTIPTVRVKISPESRERWKNRCSPDEPEKLMHRTKNPFPWRQPPKPTPATAAPEVSKSN